MKRLENMTQEELEAHVAKNTTWHPKTKATTYIIPFEYSGLCRIDAHSAEDARDLFEAMSDDERLCHADMWVDDRTFTEAEYKAETAAISADYIDGAVAKT